MLTIVPIELHVGNVLLLLYTLFECRSILIWLFSFKKVCLCLISLTVRAANMFYFCFSFIRWVLTFYVYFYSIQLHVGPVELDALQENLSNDIFAENPNCHCLQLPERSITVCSLSNSLILQSCSYDCHYVNVMVLLDCRLYMVILLCSYKSINIMFHYCVLYVQIELYARQCFVHFVWMSIYLNLVVQFWESLPFS